MKIKKIGELVIFFLVMANCMYARTVHGYYYDSDYTPVFAVG
jgi:hypothetical protein